MSSPPRTPMHGPTTSHRRHPSSLDMSLTNPSSRRHSYRRRSSGYSPITPRLSQEFDHGSPAHNFDGGGDGGLGNLADELGDVWSEDEEGAEGEYEDDMEPSHEGTNNIGVAVDHDGSTGAGSAASVNGVRDSGVAMESSSPATSRLSPQSAVKAKKHQRQQSLYDGSDYGDDSDLEANEGISPALEARMAAIESLARRGMEENGSTTDGVVKRVTEQLRDLASQIGTRHNTRHRRDRNPPPPHNQHSRTPPTLFTTSVNVSLSAHTINP
jgi:hypothetical protein